MKTFEVGTEIEYLSSFNGEWVTEKVTKVSEKYIWFKGSGFSRIAKQTFINWPYLYRIK